jgi:hypothetical protein
MQNNKTIKKIERIAKSNPLVDSSIVRESIKYVEFVRGMGSKGPDFRIIRSTEAHLLMKPPVLQKLQ